MQVKMKSILADGTRTALPGQVIEVPDKEGKDLVKGGYADEVKAKKAGVEIDAGQTSGLGDDTPPA